MARQNECSRNKSFGIHVGGLAQPTLEENICAGNGIVGIVYLGGDALTWSGALSAGDMVTRHVRLKLAKTIRAGTIVTLPVELRDDDQKIKFTRAARINVGGPQLELNHAPDAAAAFANRVVTWTLTARNSGALTAPVTLTLGVPFEQALITG